MGLIETWDVLKFTEQRRLCLTSSINRNMGCIEIGWRFRRGDDKKMINRNMGCIEIV